MTTSFQPSKHRSGALPLLLAIMMVLLPGCDIFGTAVDERAPRINIVTPYNDALVAGKNLLISVDAEPLGEDNWISYVTINMNGEQAGTAEWDGTYYNLRLNTMDLEDGIYRVEAIAFDRYQARGISAPVLVSVRNESEGPGPRASITDPTDKDEVFGVARVVARPDPGEPFVSRMDLLVDGVPVASEDTPIAGDTFVFDYDTGQLALGEHIFEVKAYSGPTVFRVSEAVSFFLVEDDGSNEGRPGGLRWKTPGITGDVDGAVAVGFNNDIYVGSTDQKVFAFSPTGSLKWTYEAKGSIDSSPLVGNNEDIFVTGSGGRLYGLSSQGNRRWGWDNHYSTGSIVRSSPSLGSDGTIYFGDSNGRLHAVSSFDGLKPSTGFWPVSVTAGEIVTPPVIARDRTIYVAATDGHVYAYDPEGVRVWKTSANIGSVMVGMAMIERQISVTLPTGDVRTTTAVVLYVVSNNGLMYALSGEDGSVLWSYPLTGPLRSAPVVGPDGTIYVGTSTGLIALNEDVDTFTPRLRFVHVAPDVGTPVIDSNETIYFMSDKTLVAIHPNNVPEWQYNIGSYSDGPLTITRDGALLVAAENGYLYAFETGSVGLNPEQWPTFQRNARHTGRLGIDATDG